MLMWAYDLIVAADNCFFADVVGTGLGQSHVDCIQAGSLSWRSPLMPEAPLNPDGIAGRTDARP